MLSYSKGQCKGEVRYSLAPIHALMQPMDTDEGPALLLSLNSLLGFGYLVAREPGQSCAAGTHDDQRKDTLPSGFQCTAVVLGSLGQQCTEGDPDLSGDVGGC